MWRRQATPTYGVLRYAACREESMQHAEGEKSTGNQNSPIISYKQFRHYYFAVWTFETFSELLFRLNIVHVDQ